MQDPHSDADRGAQENDDKPAKETVDLVDVENLLDDGGDNTVIETLSPDELDAVETAETISTRTAPAVVATVTPSPVRSRKILSPADLAAERWRQAKAARAAEVAEARKRPNEPKPDAAAGVRLDDVEALLGDLAVQFDGGVIEMLADDELGSAAPASPLASELLPAIESERVVTTEPAPAETRPATDSEPEPPVTSVEELSEDELAAIDTAEMIADVHKPDADEIRAATIARLYAEMERRNEAAALTGTKQSRPRLNHAHPVLGKAFADWERRQDRYADYSRDFGAMIRKARKEARAAKRRTAKGWSPLSEAERTASTPDEYQRARNARNNRDLRARARATSSSSTRKKTKRRAGRIAIVEPGWHRAEYERRSAVLAAWLKTSGKSQVKLRPKEREIMITWVAYQREAAHGHDTGPAAMAPAFANVLKRPVTRQSAGDYIERLATLEGVDGPWASET